MKPASKSEAQDPSYNYERSHPSREAGQGRLDDNVATPTEEPDKQHVAVTNKQDPKGQINAHDVTDQRSAQKPE